MSFNSITLRNMSFKNDKSLFKIYLCPILDLLSKAMNTIPKKDADPQTYARTYLKKSTLQSEKHVSKFNGVFFCIRIKAQPQDDLSIKLIIPYTKALPSKKYFHNPNSNWGAASNLKIV